PWSQPRSVRMSVFMKLSVVVGRESRVRVAGATAVYLRVAYGRGGPDNLLVRGREATRGVSLARADRSKPRTGAGPLVAAPPRTTSCPGHPRIGSQPRGNPSAGAQRERKPL